MEHSLTKIPVDLLKKYDRPGPRYTSYPTAPIWTDQVGNETYYDVLRSASLRTDDPLAIYCHIPFCQTRCYYCGCNTVITRSCDRVTDYIDKLSREIEVVASHLGARNKVSQLHFGGGTPTYLNNDQFGQVLDKLQEKFEFSSNCEMSVEVDPRVTTEEQVRFLTQRGFNRISIGVQDFDPDVQEACGRIQSFEMVENLMKLCRQLGFKGINIDLIYGLPRQTPETFASSMDLALKLRPDRVAVYSFAFLPAMKANQMKINPDELPDTDTKYQLFAIAIEKFLSAGYKQIGMDHFALPTDELSIAQDQGSLHRNFMGYTVKAAPEMIGLGMSSIGYIGNSFFQTISKLDSYGKAVDEHGTAVFRGMQLSRDDLLRQFVINSLMCNFRLDYKRFSETFGVEYLEYFKTEHGLLTEFAEDGFIEIRDDHLKVLLLGRTFVRNIAMTYDAYLDGKDGKKPPTFSRTI